MYQIVQAAYGEAVNRYALKPRPRRWNAKLSPLLVKLGRSYRVREQLLKHQLVNVEVNNASMVADAVASNQGVLITPNHPGHADAYCMNAAGDDCGYPFYYMSAWQVFDVLSWFGQWILQKHGCFSIDREGVDREAFKTAVHILQSRKHPLVVFPEGEVYHQNDRVTPFREGAAAMAILAAKKADRDIACIPCAIKYRYVEDPTPSLLPLMDELEERILWRPDRNADLRTRVYRLAHGLIALKEIEYLGQAQSTDESLAYRIDRLADHILRQLEDRYELKSPDTANGLDRTTPERVKEIRAACIGKIEAIEDGDAANDDNQVREQIARDLDDVFLVVQLFSYPGDYLHEDAPIERIAETLDKFEEDVLGHRTASIRAKRRAVVSFGNPTVIPSGKESRTKLKPRELTQQFESAVQSLLDDIA